VNQAGTLTVEKIREAMRLVDSIPKPPMIDLYGAPFIDKAYEINWPSNAHAWIGAKRRKVIVVPEMQLDDWFRKLKDAGIDVRLEPRYLPPQADGEVSHE
jgi:hypothetical protein